MIDLQTFRRRLRLNRIAFDAVRSAAAPGVTEIEIRQGIEAAWRTAEPHDFEFSGDIVSGERSGAIEGAATGRALRSGDTLIVDLQPGFDHCYADTTRTFFIGEPTDEVRTAYAAVLDALEQMHQLLRPGIPACMLYARMQSVLAAYGDSCPHHAGHVVGEEKLLAPRLIAQCVTPLQEGMLIALEPGIYREGRFGIRVENNYRITRDGSEELFRYPLNIEHFTLGDSTR